MRALLLIFSLCAAACSAPKPPAAAAPSDCNRTARKLVNFTGPNAQDVVEARALGADCRNAVLLITVRKATGEPLWAWATASSWMSGLGGSQASDPVAAMDAFLDSWSNVKIDTTAALPDWPERQNVFKDDLGAFMHTPFERGQYLDIRAKGEPRLCYATGVESGLCIYYDTASGAAAEVFRSGA